MGQAATASHERGQIHLGRFEELEDALAARLAERRGGDPLAPAVVIVGSAAHRTRVGDVLVRRSGALANVSIVTLTRFAADAVAASLSPLRPLTHRVAERLVERLVARSPEPLEYFAGVADRPHFAAALAATFADLRQARVRPDSGWAALACVGETRARAADLDRLYASYCAELERLRLADDAALFLAAAGLETAASTRPVAVFGLYDLNVAQEALVRSLVASGADVYVPASRGSEASGSSVVALAQEAGLSRRDLATPEDDRDLARLGAVWQRPWAVGGPPVPLAGDGSFAVVSVPDERCEAREAVRAVMAAVTGGAASWDCAVVAPRAEGVERLAAALEAAGLPVAAVRPDRSAGARLVARLVDCLSPAAGRPLGRRQVVELLTCAPLLTAAPPRTLARWQDEARRAGIVAGAGQWTDRMGRRVLGLERRAAELEEAEQRGAHASDDERDEPISLARERLAAARSLAGVSTVLVRCVMRLPHKATWRAWGTAAGELVDALFAPTEAAAARDVLARLTALDVLEEEVTWVEAAAALRELLAGGGAQVGRVGRDGVAVLTPLSLRGLRFHTVVFTGLAEGGFPAAARPDPILGDGARRRLGDALTTRLPLAEAREAESELLFAFACEAARERLVLLAPRSDAATGRPRLPSRFLLRFAALAAGGQVTLDAFLGGRPLAPVWHRAASTPASAARPETVWVDERERDVATLLELSAQGSRMSARGYLAEVLASETQADRRLGMWGATRAAGPTPWDAMLGGEALAALLARHPFAAEMHPTRLERYVGCPFAFLLRDVLRLEAPDEPGEDLEMDQREFGSLAHAILQRTYEAVIAGDLDRDAACSVLGDAWLSACADAERRGVTGAPLSWEVRRAALLDDLLEVVRRDPVFAGGGRPAAVEWSFGDDAGRPVALALPDGRRLRFAGRLDRIDATPAGARVIDYKTGRGETEQRRIKRGLSVQLPVYRLAVRQAGDRDYAEVSALYRLVTRRGGFADLAAGDDETSCLETLSRLLAEAAALVDAGCFPRSTAGTCDFCDVRYACGTSGWTRGRKRGHEALAELVRLQTAGPRKAEAPDA